MNIWHAKNQQCENQTKSTAKRNVAVHTGGKSKEALRKLWIILDIWKPKTANHNWMLRYTWNAWGTLIALINADREILLPCRLDHARWQWGRTWSFLAVLCETWQTANLSNTLLVVTTEIWNAELKIKQVTFTLHRRNNNDLLGQAYKILMKAV